MSLMKERESFQEWKDSPGTRDFLAYLAERQKALTEAWGRGAPLTPEQQAQAVVLWRLSQISFDDMIEHFELENGDGQGT